MFAGVWWRGGFGQYRMPFVSTPYLIMASQYDSWQLRFDVCDDMLGCVIPAAALPYTDGYGMLVQQYMNGLPGAGLRNTSAVYSQACYNHHMSESDLFWTAKNDHGLASNDALHTWLQVPGGYHWVDKCTGYQCSAGCSV
eukprot:TRINITY_DN47329_c0_g1_i1.p1 TRINITY_DN47329_c0_g1~~TRINITY_DN47329_c0_g1_i1.p1  ORF type:complete len:140 (+),score=27.43 TRINITY_DN47329_c0_g1_i1:120-539(+)